MTANFIPGAISIPDVYLPGRQIIFTHKLLPLDRIVLTAHSEWWPSIGYFSTVMKVKFSFANSTTDANFRPFLCMVFLIGLLTYPY